MAMFQKSKWHQFSYAEIEINAPTERVELTALPADGVQIHCIVIGAHHHNLLSSQRLHLGTNQVKRDGTQEAARRLSL